MSSRYAVILIQNPENPKEYLMGKRLDNGRINFPAGGIDDSEDPAKGAEREVHEETGLNATNLKMVGVYRKEKQGKPIIVYVYTAKFEGAPNLEQDPDREFQSIFWANPFKIRSEDLHIPAEENSGIKALVELLKK